VIITNDRDMTTRNLIRQALIAALRARLPGYHAVTPEVI
jgi:hypothetical protein